MLLGVSLFDSFLTVLGIISITPSLPFIDSITMLAEFFRIFLKSGIPFLSGHFSHLTLELLGWRNIKLKVGTLKQQTYIHTVTNFVFKVQKGTKVIVRDNVLTFNPIEGVQIFKVSGCFFVNLWGAVHQVVLPGGGRAPYPLSMI